MEEQQTIYSLLFESDTKQAEKQIEELQKKTNVFSQTMVSAFDQIVVKGRDAESVFKSLALQISKQALKKAIFPAQAALGTGLGFDISGIVNSALAFAKGGAFSSGVVGGALNSPIGFPLGGGNVGVAGEAGPEAILPLSRGPNGELGVRMQEARPMAVTINISTPDVESFARSEGEIAASLQRIVSRGNRNL